MSFRKTLTLSTKAILPQIGLGTWLSKPKEVERAVEIAVRNGYRHLDLAFIYENQDEVGAALKNVIPSVVKREELFITSKLWCNGFRPENVEKQLDQGLAQTGLDYFDLYLIHWPVAFKAGEALYPPDEQNPGWVELDRGVTLAETWKAMNALPKSKVRAVGVSNFSVPVLEELINATGIVPTVNQIEAHPLLPQDDLVAYCKEKNIHLTAYSPLGNNLKGKPKLTDYPEVKAIAQRLGATEAQVLVAWGAQRGYSVIPKSVQEDRIISNFQQVELSQEDIEALNALSKDGHTRFNIPHHYTPRWDINIFDEPEEQTASNKPLVA
ncbi:Aldo/keto reductase [Serendipita vermifera]|nr:Aldo/keto reductase [Serendipita vermifera]